MIESTNKLVDKIMQPINVYAYWLKVLQVITIILCFENILIQFTYIISDIDHLNGVLKGDMHLYMQNFN